MVIGFYVFECEGGAIPSKVYISGRAVLCRARRISSTFAPWETTTHRPASERDSDQGRRPGRLATTPGSTTDGGPRLVDTVSPWQGQGAVTVFDEERIARIRSCNHPRQALEEPVLIIKPPGAGNHSPVDFRRRSAGALQPSAKERRSGRIPEKEQVGTLTYAR